MKSAFFLSFIILSSCLGAQVVKTSITPEGIATIRQQVDHDSITMYKKSLILLEYYDGGMIDRQVIKKTRENHYIIFELLLHDSPADSSKYLADIKLEFRNLQYSMQIESMRKNDRKFELAEFFDQNGRIRRKYKAPEKDVRQRIDLFNLWLYNFLVNPEDLDK